MMMLGDDSTNNVEAAQMRSQDDFDEVAQLAASLRAINQKVLKSGYESGMVKLWFQGREPYFDVFFKLKNDEIAWFQFTLRGKSLTWDINKQAWKTGNSQEMTISSETHYPASRTIDTDSHLDWEFINLVKAIIQARADEPIFAKALALFDT